jgi:HD-like signal output (HDOD) protein
MPQDNSQLLNLSCLFRLSELNWWPLRCWMATSEDLIAALKEVVSRGDFVVPPYPAVALRLQKVLANPIHGVAEVADVIAADAALAATILAASNSATQRGAHEITTLGRAVNRLGSRSVASLALAASVGSGATSPGVLFDVKYRAWRRSITCALICQRLARGRGLDPEESFLAGLLHGFGRSVAIASLEKVILTHKPARPLSVSEWLSIAEKNRAELALAVGQHWKLPHALTVSFDPSTADSALGRLLFDADRTAAQIEANEVPHLTHGNEGQLLDELIKGLPQALVALAPPPDRASKPSDAVATVTRPSPCDKRPKDLAVLDLRASAPAQLRCLGIGPATLELDSSRHFQESSVARVAVGRSQPAPDFWFTVVSSVPSERRYHVDLQLFSPAKEVRELWQAAYLSA